MPMLEALKHAYRTLGSSRPKRGRSRSRSKAAIRAHTREAARGGVAMRYEIT